MINLYIKTGCPFCSMVLQKIDSLKIDVQEKNIADEKNLNELLSLGGKRQVPFMVDEDKNVSIYESQDIVDHLEKFYGSEEKLDEDNNNRTGVCPVK